ncbi:MAG: hypothetical protein ACOCXQ_01675 [Patescibacteria group bacterium]
MTKSKNNNTTKKKSSDTLIGYSEQISNQVLAIFLMSIVLLYVLLNVIASQQVNPLYSRFVREEVEAEVAFYAVVKDLPEFRELYPLVDDQYRQLEAEIVKDDITRKQQIENLETYLEQNPNARDIYVAIAQLYRQGGDIEMAADYMDRARKIDPGVDKVY